MKKISTEIKQLFIVNTLIFMVLAAGVTQLYGYLIEDNVLNAQIRSEAKYLGQTLTETQYMPTPRYPFMSLAKNWGALPELIQKQHKASPERIEFIGPQGESLHIIEINPCREHCLLVANVDGFTFANRAWYVSAGGMLLISLVIGIISALGIFRLLNRVTAPIMQLQSQVEKDAEELQFNQGFIRNMPDNEVGFLARTIGTQWQKMKGLLAREKQFTRDISHELRTPLSVLQNQLRQWQLNSQINTQLAQSQVEKITQTLDILTALARSESQSMATIKALETIENVMLTLSVQTKASDFELKLDVPMQFTVMGNQQLFELLVYNLIDNAQKYSQDKVLSISAQNNQIRFSNTVAHAIPTEVLQSGVKGNVSDGIGQGLSLAQRIMEFHKGLLLVSIKEESGQRIFIITAAFPAA